MQNGKYLVCCKASRSVHYEQAIRSLMADFQASGSSRSKDAAKAALGEKLASLV